MAQFNFFIIVLNVILVGCLSSRGSSQLTSQGVTHFPRHPELAITPGSTCINPDEIRYPEGIKYCKRDVSQDKKKSVIAAYDNAYGYSLRSLDRADIKIDHFIPLCMGGANDRKNLWPQHKSLFAQTDQIEMKLCQLMALGKILQADAITQMTRVKLSLEEAEALNASLDQQLGAAQ